MSLAINDLLSPALRAKLARISDKRPILKAAGAALASASTQAFRHASMRPAEWPALSPKTLARKTGPGPLRESTALMRSLLAKEPSGDSVEVGTDREYALYHQFGTKNMPARPFFPVLNGRMTEKAERRVRGAVAGEVAKALGAR